MKIALLLCIAACGFSKLPKLGGNDDAPTIHDATDAPADMTPLPDAGPCTAFSAECVSPDINRVCWGAGYDAVDYHCDWGCVSAGNNTHCATIIPSFGDATSIDTYPWDLNTFADVTLSGPTTINGDDGSITNARGSGTGVISGISYAPTTFPEIVVFRMKSLMITGPVTITGLSSIAIVVEGPLVVANVIDDRGPCQTLDASPGGYPGGPVNGPGPGPSGGGQGSGQSGAGGAGNGGPGGMGGGSGGAGGGTFGAPSQLYGGAGGGGASATGGHGGGALQLISNGAVTIAGGGGINAGGCGGHAGTSGGGGGGAGGLIVIEARTVTIDGALAVNGGGGAGGGTAAGNGADGSLDRNQAAGGSSSASAGGGAGGAGGNLAGRPGLAPMLTAGGGGGGGGGGQIIVHTQSGLATIGASAVLSPAPTDPGTTFTQSKLVIQ